MALYALLSNEGMGSMEVFLAKLLSVFLALILTSRQSFGNGARLPKGFTARHALLRSGDYHSGFFLRSPPKECATCQSSNFACLLTTYEDLLEFSPHSSAQLGGVM